MSQRTIEIKTRAGVCPCHFILSPAGGTRPAVIIYMDAFGIRPAMLDMADRLAGMGYHVLLPDLYYRSGATKPLEPAVAFKEGPERDRLMSMVRSLNNTMVMEDTASFLEFLSKQPNVGPKTGCVGYCMGGPFALSAAGTFPDRIAAAASFHGARLATDQPDSPHRLAPKMRGEIYVGIAGIDQHFTPEEKQRLASALADAHVKHLLEVYPNAKHGFAVNDTPAYERGAADMHWQQLRRLFAENLAA